MWDPTLARAADECAARISAWFWDELSPSLDDPFVRMGCSVTELPLTAEQAIEVMAAGLGRAPAIANYLPIARRLKTVLQEILAAGSPRGDAIGVYATNRASSALYGPARRIYYFDAASPSSHEEIEAVSGLQAFLAGRGYSEAEIAAFLTPDRADDRQPVEDFSLFSAARR